MFDIRRIRERAADWLGDVGAAALFVAGDVLGAVGKAVRGEPHEEAFERGDESDDELRTRIKATRARGEPCPGFHVDCEPCDLCASPPEPAAPRIEVRDGVEWLAGADWDGANKGCHAHSAPEDWWSCTAHIDGQHVATTEVGTHAAQIWHRWPIGPAAGTSPPAGQGPAPHPPGGVQTVDGGALWGVYADILTERMAQDRKWGGPKHDDAHEVSEWVVFIQEKLDRAEEADDDAGYRRRMVQVAALAVAAVESLDRQRAPAVKPPHNEAPGALGEAVRAIDGLNLIASEGKRIGWPHGERKPVALADLGLTAADLARTSPMPPPGPWRDLVERAQAETPANLCAIAAEATRATDARAAPPAASAAERVPESPSGGAGAPWRGLEYDVGEATWDPGVWVAEARDYIATFDGQHAEERAREYAALMSEPAEDPAPSACDACGKPASTGRCFACTVALQGTEAVRATLVDSGPPALPKPDAVRVGQRWQWVGDADGEEHRRPFAVDRVLVKCAEGYSESGQLHVGEIDKMLSSPLYRFLGMVKPSRVEVGQRWRCVGVDGEFVVRWLYEDGVSVRLGPAEDEASGKIVARIADMLGLREWSYVGGGK